MIKNLIKSSVSKDESNQPKLFVSYEEFQAKDEELAAKDLLIANWRNRYELEHAENEKLIDDHAEMAAVVVELYRDNEQLSEEKKELAKRVRHLTHSMAGYKGHCRRMKVEIKQNKRLINQLLKQTEATQEQTMRKKPKRRAAGKKCQRRNQSNSNILNIHKNYGNTRA